MPWRKTNTSEPGAEIPLKSPKVFEWVKSIDTEGKISIYEDDFYVPGLSNRENDTRERNMLARFMGEGAGMYR